MIYSEAIDKIIPALVEAQAAITPAAKDAENAHFKNKYADLASIWAACREPLHKNGLCAVQDVRLGEFGVEVVTRLWHTSGQWIEFGPLVVPLFKRDAHGVGSAATYGKRYSLAAAIGIVAEEDDDGNGATDASKKDKGKGFIERMPPPKDAEEKSPPGIAAVRSDVNNAVREFNACGDADELTALLSTPAIKRLAVKVFNEFPTLWTGPEAMSGFKGSLEQAAVNVGASDFVIGYLRSVESAAKSKA